MQHLAFIGRFYLRQRSIHERQSGRRLAGSQTSAVRMGGIAAGRRWSTTVNIPDQVQRLPKEATHLVLSGGGNNALTEASRLGISFFGFPDVPTSKALDSLADISGDFEAQYRSAVDSCLRPGLPLGVCTIYNGCFPDKSYQRIASLALAVFNDVILRVAIERGLPVIDLRLICKHSIDYANPIEPSSIGGEKIVKVNRRIGDRPPLTR